MSYFKTKYGQIINENNEVIPMDESSILYQDYLQYLQAEGTVYDTDYICCDDPILIEQAINIDSIYTTTISKLLRKHVEKWAIEGTPIPQDTIDERDRLRAECNQKIIELGVTDFSYRSTVLSL